jgi:hypothetical protein
VLLVETLHLFPLMTLSIVDAMSKISPSLDEAAESVGSRGLRKFFEITLPLTTPGFVTGALLVFIWTFADFATPLVVGVDDLLASQAYLNIVQFVDRRLFKMGIVISAIMVLLAIFFLIPRIGAGFFQKNRVDLIRTSGFSEKVDLGVIGAVKLDPTVVMRVELPDQKGPVPEGLYFRGAAYDTYDGRSWANRLAGRRILERTPDGAFQVQSQQAPAGAESPGLRQEILIEALDTSVLFGAPFADSVKGNFMSVQMDGMRGLYLPYPPSARFHSASLRASNGTIARKTIWLWPRRRCRARRERTDFPSGPPVELQ